VQLEECRKLAESRGWVIVDEYIDPGASGRSDKGRPQFNAMIREGLAEDPPFNVILVYDHSRFYRNVGESEVLRAKLGLNDVQVFAVKQPIEDDGLLGSFAITMQAAMDDHQSRVTAMKVRDGMAANARDGFYVGGTVPYGYRLEAVATRGSKTKNKLAIEPYEAQVIKMIFDLYESGMGQKAIITKLNEDGFMRRGRPWFKSAIIRILSSTTYAGRHIFRPTDWRTKKTGHRSKWITIPYPAIIEEAQFQNVQQLVEQRKPSVTPPRHTTSDVLLGKIAKCGSCGSGLQLATGTGRSGTVYHYYNAPPS